MGETIQICILEAPQDMGKWSHLLEQNDLNYFKFTIIKKRKWYYDNRKLMFVTLYCKTYDEGMKIYHIVDSRPRPRQQYFKL